MMIPNTSETQKVLKKSFLKLPVSVGEALTKNQTPLQEKGVLLEEINAADTPMEALHQASHTHTHTIT